MGSDNKSGGVQVSLFSMLAPNLGIERSQLAESSRKPAEKMKRRHEKGTRSRPNLDIRGQDRDQPGSSRAVQTRKGDRAQASLLNMMNVGPNTGDERPQLSGQKDVIAEQELSTTEDESGNQAESSAAALKKASTKDSRLAESRRSKATSSIKPLHPIFNAMKEKTGQLDARPSSLPCVDEDVFGSSKKHRAPLIKSNTLSITGLEKPQRKRRQLRSIARTQSLDTVVPIINIPFPDGPSSFPPESSGAVSTDDAQIDIDLTQSSPSNASANDANQLEGSQHTPITIESSPVKAEFFPPRKRIKVVEDRMFGKRSTAPDMIAVSDAPFPSSESVHVRGDQSVFDVGSISLPRRTSNPSSFADDQKSSSLQSRFAGDSSESHHPRYSVQYIESNEERVSHMQKIPLSQRVCHAAISRITSLPSDHHYPFPSQEIWADRWRPRRACEVLGNESLAEYLKTWLLALTLRVDRLPSSNPDVENACQDAGRTDTKYKSMKMRNMSMPDKGFKRPKVIRKVDKGKGRKRRRIDDSDEGDFIQDDEEEISAFEASDSELLRWPDQEDPECESGRPSRLRRGPCADIENPESIDVAIELENSEKPPPIPAGLSPNFSSYLTNTVLLTGPSGSGKTAAVYACAEELGWEVFEVYPGVGKRSGASLAALIGDVSKNHLVGKAPPLDKSGGEAVQDLKAKKGLASIFTKAKKPENVEARPTSPQDDRTVPGIEEVSASASYNISDERELVVSNSTVDPISQGQPSSFARQSIILLEEVDILYSEDVNFWPAVINLIQDSHRPIVMTCNDPSLVPISDLPLQTVLHFSPCPSPLAVSYLGCMALSEGYMLPPGDILRLHESSVHSNYRIDMSEDLARASLGHKSAVSDLRRAINGLQMLCQIPREESSLLTARLASDHPLEDDSHNNKLSDWSLVNGVLGVDPVIESPTYAARNSQALRHLERFTDAVSFADSHISRRQIASLGIFSTGEQNGPSDNELGYSTFTDLEISDDSQWNCALYNSDDAIAHESISLERRRLEICGPDHQMRETLNPIERVPNDTEQMLFARTGYLSSGFEALNHKLISLPITSLASSALAMDYVPWVRHMVSADDLLEVASMTDDQGQVLRRGGRVTRSVQKQVYIRYVSLNERERGALDALAFDRDDA